MLWQIIKAYCKSRKGNYVIIITTHWKEVFSYSPDDNKHIRITVKDTRTLLTLKLIDYVGNTRIVEDQEPGGIFLRTEDK